MVIMSYSRYFLLHYDEDLNEKGIRLKSLQFVNAWFCVININNQSMTLNLWALAYPGEVVDDGDGFL